MCSLKGYGFSAVLVINRLSILANFGLFDTKYRVWFLHCSLDIGMSLFPHNQKGNQALHIYVYGLVGTMELIITQL